MYIFFTYIWYYAELVPSESSWFEQSNGTLSHEQVQFVKYYVWSNTREPFNTTQQWRMKEIRIKKPL